MDKVSFSGEAFMMMKGGEVMPNRDTALQKFDFHLWRKSLSPLSLKVSKSDQKEISIKHVVDFLLCFN